MTRDEIDAFKNFLKNLRFYESEIKRLQEEIDELQYLIDGVHGVSFGGVKVRSDKKYKYNLDAKREKLEEKKRFYLYIVNYLNNILNSCSEETKNALIEVYADGVALDKVCIKYNYSKNGLFYKIHAELNKLETLNKNV